MENQLAHIEQEAEFLRFLKDNFTTNPKKLKKLALREGALRSKEIQQGIVFNISRSADPVGYVRECFKQAFDYPIIIEQFINNGDHGMVVVDGAVYPVRIETQSNWLQQNDRWSLDDELDIQHNLVEQWMIANKVSNFKGKILLFPFFGFSGLFRRIIKQRVFGKFIND